ncbi:MAG: HEAT repeat domain-containing protein, partial [Actinobacteria bacterium]|nr:HEAT repeat domain-containing protein [Actinomycetota bacterium]
MGIPDKLINVEKMQANKDFKGLIRALKDENGHVREQAAVALGEIKDARAVEPLIKAL